MHKLLSRIAILTLVLFLTFSFFPAQTLAAGIIYATPPSGPPRTAVTVTGNGFTDSVVILYYDTTVINGSLPATGGNFTATFNVPESGAGTHIIHAVGATSGDIQTTFTVTPILTAVQSSGTVGTSITVNGSGYTANETGTRVTYDGVIVANVPTVSAAGTFSATFAVPDSASGSHAITTAGGLTVTPSYVYFTVTPNVKVSTTSGSAGTAITVTGTGFSASEPGINVTYDGTTVTPTPVSANDKGGWTANFTVPPSPSGSHIIGAFGSITAASTVPTATFASTAGISINKTAGIVGSAATVVGAGFASGETGITITFDGTAVTSGVTASAKGAWSANFVVPASASGNHVIDASSASTPANTIADLNFNVTPIITINRTGGATGSVITVTGTGFGASETGITITYDGDNLVTSINANQQGGWSSTFKAPSSAAGPHTIGAGGTMTQPSSVSTLNFNIGAGVSISSSFGPVGATVEITGSGFTANSPIRFLYDNKEIPNSGITSDASGSFDKSIIIPKSVVGSHSIKITDGQRNETVATYTVDSAPPKAPTLTSPGDGTKLGFLGNVTPTFRWSAVTEPSGVTYTLQIATDPDFSQIILEKKDIPGTSFKLTTSDALAGGTYYWRVRAVNGASAEGTWSQVYVIGSGVMSTGVLVMLIILIVIALAVAAYILYTRTQRRRMETAAVRSPMMPEGFQVNPTATPGQWRLLGTANPDTAARDTSPMRNLLALPSAAPAKKGKGQQQSPSLSPQDMARLKVIIDFAQSLPLVEAGYTTNWLVELVQTIMGIEVTGAVYERILKGELQVRYEPAWMRHPTYQDLTSLLQGQPVMQDLNTYLDFVNRCSGDATALLQDIYRDAGPELPPDFLAKGGWKFFSGVYSDSLSWYLGKSLRDPSDRDYIIKPAEGENSGALYLWGTDTTTFAEPLIEVSDEEEAIRFRTLHLRLRRTYRNNERARQLVATMTQLEMQRGRLTQIFSQFGQYAQ